MSPAGPEQGTETLRVDDERWMHHALALAHRAEQEDDEVPIGAVLVSADGEILGVHMIGSGVTELIGEGVTAMGLEGAVADMAHLIHAHTTLSESVNEALEAVFGDAIHI